MVVAQRTGASGTTKTYLRLSGSIWALGFVSMFMDISSEMIHGLLPTFLVTVLGASAEMVGLIEGVGEATASISKLFSGWISDRIGTGKRLRSWATGWGRYPSRSSRSRRPPLGYWLPGFPTASARVFEARRAMRWSAISPRRSCAAPPTVCGSS